MVMPGSCLSPWPEPEGTGPLRIALPRMAPAERRAKSAGAVPIKRVAHAEGPRLGGSTLISPVSDPPLPRRRQRYLIASFL
jgi:hypothetical protein